MAEMGTVTGDLNPQSTSKLIVPHHLTRSSAAGALVRLPAPATRGAERGFSPCEFMQQKHAGSWG